MKNKYVVIDLETTGHSAAKGDKIIEIGMVVIENDVITDQFSSFFQPNKEIPSFISNLTGITSTDVKDAPHFYDKANDIVAILKDAYIVAHNVSFDLGFLNGELQELLYKPLNNPVLDTVELSRVLFPYAPGFKLGQLAEYFKLEHRDPHRALSDAYVTAELFLILKTKLYKMPYETITHLLKLESILKSDLFSILTNVKNKLSFSLSEDSSIHTYKGLAFKRPVEFSTEESTPQLSYGAFLDDIYEDDGALKQFLPTYEKREGQRDMSEHIYDAFQSNYHALIEAETGTGKSLGYLLPAIYESVKTGQRIIISTFTTQLQSQLLDEETPLMKKLLPFPFHVALLKGKRHYISLEKFEKELRSEQRDNYDVALTKAMILVWLTETETGDIDEISLPSSGYYFYNKVSSDIEGAIQPSSPWFNYSFYQKARERAQKANIIIVNHALLCTDMYNDYSFIPSYQKTIIDEAHHLEDTASHHYGLKLDYVDIIYSLNQIGGSEDNGWFHNLIDNHTSIKNDIPIDKWDQLMNDLKYELDQLFRTIFQYVVDQHKKDKSTSDIGRLQYRFEEEKEEKTSWSLIKEMINRLTFYFRDMIHFLIQINQNIELDKHEEDEMQAFLVELQTYIDSFEHLFIEGKSSEHVKWIEVEVYGAKNAVYLYSEPTDVSTILSTDLFNEKKSVILTSATLTMRNSFSYIQKRLGIPEERLIKEKIKSPFSYQNQVQLMIPNDFPDIKYGKLDDFIYSVAEAIISLAEITSGRMLVLFTSYDMLRRTYYLLKETSEFYGFNLIAQGISSGSRSRLKKNFQTYDKAILLGTSSFWEGIDIPGENLSCLMIARLPFQPPNHPLYEAKSKNLEANGKNPFFELALPHAVLRFKQGFGRLIRSTNDRGIVFICDARIVKARYGSFFTKSIPDVPISYDSTSVLMQNAKVWF